MESISRLKAVLTASLSGRGLHNGEQQLFEELITHRTRFLNVFDVGVRNPQQQRDIEAGKTTINGRQVAVNADFAKQAISLSQALECSEQYVATILHSTMNENPNITTEQCIEAVVSEFHSRRRDLADCLSYLFEAAEGGSVEGDEPILRQIFAFVLEALAPTIASKIFQEIESIDGLLSRALNARQNAGSNTVAPSNTGPAALGYEILNARCESLKYERRCLATALCTLGRLGHVNATCLMVLVDWLSKNHAHPMTYYILTATLSTLDPVDPDSYAGKARATLASSSELMAHMKKKLASTSDWGETGLKAVITMQWSLFLADSRHRDPSLERKDGYQTEELKTQIWNAVQSGAFSYLTLTSLHLRGKRSGSSPISYAHQLALSPEQDSIRDLPPPDFKQLVYSAFESLIRSLISHASSELRKIKQRQEDLVLANVRARASTRFVADQSSSPRNDITVLFSFIGLLYQLLPSESALQFWGSVPQQSSRHSAYQQYEESHAGKLPAFLQWAVWSTHSHDVDMSTALYDMLAGLSKGQQCSELAYNFMARGGGEVIQGSSLSSSTNTGSALSWGTIFATLETWATSANTSRSQQQIANAAPFGGSHWQQPPSVPPQPRQATIGPKEVLLAQAFLRLLSGVVAHSVVVRLAIAGHTHFRAIPTLVSLLPLGVPLELKGAIFDTLAAFCEPGGGTQGVELCKTVWTLMERMEVINVRAMSGGLSGGLSPVKGVEVELEEVETVYKMYPATIPFLRLLAALIHTPKRLPMADLINEAEPINTIPDGLGTPYRLPGIGPFISFVVDNVFSRISSRDYARPSERWQMNDLCLAFIERALASYDLRALLSVMEDGQMKPESLMPFMVHPGYDIMKRVLSNSPLQASLLSYIVEGVEGFEKDFAEEEPYFRSTVIRVLRIVDRVLETQDIFLDVLIPLLSQYNDTSTIVGPVQSRSYFTKFDQAMSYGSQYVPAIAVYAAHTAESELVLLSVKIMTALSNSSAFGNLTTLVEQSAESVRILNGYRKILGVDTAGDVTSSEAIIERCTGAGAPDVSATSNSFEQAIQAAALNLLLRGTKEGQKYPNISHFLLFGTSTAQQIQDPHALGAQTTCFHVILDLINAGIPRLKTKGKSREHKQGAVPLFVVAPGVAELCYRLIHQLCSHPRTSDFTMRYLRTREDFFARQIAAIPSHVPTCTGDPYIELLFTDSSRVITTVHAMSSFIKLRSWIFDMAALDLHVLTANSHNKGVSDMLSILYGNETDAQDVLAWEDDVLQPFREAGQSHMRIIEFVQSLNFEWMDSLSVKQVDLKFLGNLNLLSCIRTDASGCDVIDDVALLSLLSIARKNLHSLNAINSAADLEQLNAEANYIMESCAVENHRREVRFVTGIGYESWRRLLDMTLTRCFSRLPHDKRENMLFDLLHVLPQIIRSSDIQESTAVLLSEAVLTSITKLREDRHYQVLTQTSNGGDSTGSLPAERLHAILRSILECILENNRIELVRGNLYAALCSYLHLISSEDSPSVTPLIGEKQTLLLTSSALSRSVLSLDEPRSTPLYQSQSANSAGHLIAGSLALVKSIAERLIATIARDAVDGTEVWRTVAFMLLDALVDLSRTEKQHTLLSALIKHGILSNFVRDLHDLDVRLQSVLKPDPDELNPLYVYEAKMSLFIRMAQTRASAERLLEAQVLQTLTQCDFLDARPEANQSFIDNDSFLPSAIQRYHQLLMPALQLVNSMVATLGQKHATLNNLALEFIAGHRDTLVILLKTDPNDASLALVEEIYLIIALCTKVLPFVPKSELSSGNTGFGALHSTILSLSSRCLAGGKWAPAISPQTDREVVLANSYSSAYGSETKFEAEIKQAERLLRKAVIEYIGTASDYTEPEITVVLSPIAAPAKTSASQDERSTRFIATIPSIGDAIEALNGIVLELADTLKLIANFSAELNNREHIQVDNIAEIVNEFDSDLLEDLDVNQKRTLICRQLTKLRRVARDETNTIRIMTEQSLLLIWRHLAHYSSPDTAPPSAPSSSFNATRTFAMRLLSAGNAGDDRQGWLDDISRRLAPTLDKIAGLENEFFEFLTNDVQWRSSLAYMDIMCRRLRDCMALPEEEPSKESGIIPVARQLAF